MDGISQKRFLRLTPPSEADNRSAQARVLDALREEGHEIIEVGTMSLEQIVPHSQTAHAAAEVIQRGD